MVNQAKNGTSPSNQTLITELQALLPHVAFKPGDVFAWSAEHSTVTYRPSMESNESIWALLHEAGHALLGHQNYTDDIDLLNKEVEAWRKAQDIGIDRGVKTDVDHIEDCLDTYRDWLHQRATCPVCATVSLQVSHQTYLCHNCSASWNVSVSRHCRSYRTSQQKIARG